jgi:hypothetical protein
MILWVGFYCKTILNTTWGGQEEIARYCGVLAGHLLAMTEKYWDILIQDSSILSGFAPEPPKKKAGHISIFTDKHV